MRACLPSILGNLVVLAVGLAILLGLPALAETYLIINATIFAAFASASVILVRFVIAHGTGRSGFTTRS